MQKLINKNFCHVAILKNLLKPISKYCGELITDNYNDKQLLSVDSNDIKKDSIFIGIRGSKINGGIFAKQALQREASFCIIDEEASQIIDQETLKKCLVVSSTKVALDELAKHARQSFHGKMIGVTGSIGKTTTKEMLKTAFSSKNREKQEIFTSHKNHNSSIGVPVSLFHLNQVASIAILEMGMSHAGELSKLSNLVKPEIAIITNINPVHLGHFSDLDDIAHAKSEIFESMVGGQIAILNRDDRFYEILKENAIKKQLEIITFGIHDGSDIRLIEYTTLNANSLNVSVEYKGEKIHYRINETGQPFLYASLAMLATTAACDMPLEECAENIQNFEALDGRGKIHVLPNTISIIDDSYSSSPIALISALDKLHQQKQYKNGRIIAILGDMVELGKHTKKFHAQIQNKLEEIGIDLLFTVGPEMKNIFHKMPQAAQGMASGNSLELVDHIRANLEPNDTILIKGSRIWQMDLLVKKLLEILG